MKEKFRIKKITDGFGNERYYAQVKRGFFHWYCIDEAGYYTGDYLISCQTYKDALDKIELYKKRHTEKCEIFNIE